MLKWLTAKVLSNNTVLYQLMVKVLVLTLCRNCSTVSANSESSCVDTAETVALYQLVVRVLLLTLCRNCSTVSANGESFLLTLCRNCSTVSVSGESSCVDTVQKL